MQNCVFLVSELTYDSNMLIMGQGVAKIFESTYFTGPLAMNVETTSIP